MPEEMKRLGEIKIKPFILNQTVTYGDIQLQETEVNVNALLDTQLEACQKVENRNRREMIADLYKTCACAMCMAKFAKKWLGE